MPAKHTSLRASQKMPLVQWQLMKLRIVGHCTGKIFLLVRDRAEKAVHGLHVYFNY